MPVGDVPFNFFDKRRTLRFNLNAVSSAEIRFRVSFNDFLLPGVGALGRLHALLWCGFLHEDEDLTFEQVGMMFEAYLGNKGQIEKVRELVDQALRESTFLGSLTEANRPNGSAGAPTPTLPENASPGVVKAP